MEDEVTLRMARIAWNDWRVRAAEVETRDELDVIRDAMVEIDKRTNETSMGIVEALTNKSHYDKIEHDRLNKAILDEEYRLKTVIENTKRQVERATEDKLEKIKGKYKGKYAERYIRGVDGTNDKPWN